MRLPKGKFARHMMSAIVAQGLSLLQSTFMTFVVAKILDQTVFAWWQWFLFLSGFSHYLHIGVGEGILLKYGGKKYKELDHDLLSNEYKSYLLLQLICAIIICIFGYCCYGFSDEGICVILAGFYMIAYNMTYFLAQVLISCNRTPEYSRAVIADKALLFLTSVCIIVAGYRGFLWFAILYTIGQYLELFICKRKTIEISSGHFKCVKSGAKSIWNDASQGFFLSLSTFLANQITSIGKLFIRLFNGLLDFGVLSIANSLCNFLLIFIRQIGTVIFPFLRESDENKRKLIYSKALFVIEIITLFSLVFYFPLRYLFEGWLSKYADSFVYMSYIMPIIVLDSQMSALNTPYLNTMRKERVLLCINAFALFVTIIASIASIKCFESIELVALSISIGMATKNYISMIYIQKKYDMFDKKNVLNLAVQVIMLTVFVVTSRAFTWIAMLTYMACLGLYCFIHYKDICGVVATIRHKQ